MIPPILLIVNVQNPQSRYYLPLPIIILWPLLIPVHLLISAVSGIYVGCVSHTERLMRGIEVALRMFMLPSQLRGLHFAFRESSKHFSITII